VAEDDVVVAETFAVECALETRAVAGRSFFTAEVPVGLAFGEPRVVEDRDSVEVVEGVLDAAAVDELLRAVEGRTIAVLGRGIRLRLPVAPPACERTSLAGRRDDDSALEVATAIAAAAPEMEDPVREWLARLAVAGRTCSATDFLCSCPAEWS